VRRRGPMKEAAQRDSGGGCMHAIDTAISDHDRTLLNAHYRFYRSLDTGERRPSTLAQRHFVAVCRDSATPETDHEHAYARFKSAVVAAGVDLELVAASGFIVPASITGSARVDVVNEADIAVRACAGCGRVIPAERLKAVPEATQCVPCQKTLESFRATSGLSNVVCPRCADRGLQSQLVWRTARDPSVPGYFLACSRFPQCRYIDRS
jgi:Prokaryotic dksA/traR C4-type zinc finger